MKKLRRKMKENVAATKFWILMGLIFVQCLLVGGIFLAPDRQLIPQSQLVTTQTFTNGGTLQLTSQEYDAKNKIMKIDVQATSDLSMNQLTPHIFVKNASGSTMQYIPTVDNKAEIFIKNISSQFEVLALAFQNTSLSNQDIDTTIFNNSQDAQTSKTSQTNSSQSSNLVYFYISSNSKYLKIAKHPIKIERQSAYAIDAIQEEINFQNSQTKKMDRAISDLKKSQDSNNEQIAELQLKNNYLTGGNLANNQNQIQSLQAQVAGASQQIQQANQNKQTITQAIQKMQQQISDIKSGKYKFQDDAKSQKLK